ncbi:hypothetical protein HRJ34_14965 [Rhizorhabdus wittichii]|uniref:Lipoprotein n=1 Tax=Rhizorhabdus wittichii TaxID=160791 RepID=A0A975CYK9_9SPHN|nr:hypothetical protein [Rhizorhabdus wittichii]QTH19674.1 hypothetical protein HRJ34_14965 [Rhizorhabdus wittichii]
MRITRFAVAVAAVLTLCACVGERVESPGNTAPSSATSVIDLVTVEGTRNLLRAEVAYRAALKLVLPRLKDRTIHGATAQAVRDVNRACTTALKLAKQAKTASEMAAHVAALTRQTVTLRSFAPG